MLFAGALLSLWLVAPARGLLAVYSALTPAGEPIPLHVRVDPALDFATPHRLIQPFAQHWNLDRLPLPAEVPPLQVRWTGFLRSPRPGTHRLQVRTSGEVRFLLGGRPVAPGPDGTAAVDLRPGWHPVDLTYRRVEGDPGVQVLWEQPGRPGLAPVPPSALAPSERAIRARPIRQLGGAGLIAAGVLAGIGFARRRHRPESLAGWIAANRHQVALAGILLLALLLRLHRYDAIPFHNETADEYAYGWEGWSLIHEGIPVGWTFYPQHYPPSTITRIRWLGDPFYLARPYFDHQVGFALLAGAACTAQGADRMFDCTLRKTRLLPILLSLVTLVLIALCGWRYFDTRLPGTLAALLFATLPPIVLGNRLVKSDNLLAPLLLLAFLLADRYRSAGGSRRRAGLAGLAAVALWTKATGVVVPVTAGLILATKKRWRGIGVIAAAAALAAALFLAYGAAYDWTTFTKVLELESTKSVSLRTVLDLATTSRVVETPFGTGWYIFLIAATVWMAAAREKPILLLPAAAYFVILTATADSRGLYGWYRLPLFPWLCLAAGWLLAEWWREKDALRGFLLAATALPAALTAALPPSAADTRAAVVAVFGLTLLPPVWAYFRPSPLAERLGRAGVLAALAILFAGNAVTILRQDAAYPRNSLRTVAPAARDAAPAPAPLGLQPLEPTP